MAGLDYAVLAIYLALMVGLGFWARTRQKNVEDYYVAGRRLGPFTIACLWIAAWIGAADVSPALVLLHGLACTALLNWYPALPALTSRYRVIGFDQRWHGKGIQSNTFSLEECADDLPALLHDEVDRVPVEVVALAALGTVRHGEEAPLPAIDLVPEALNALHDGLKHQLFRVRHSSRTAAASC